MTIFFLALIALVSLLCFNNKEWAYQLHFSPYRIAHNKEYWRFISHIFVHASSFHLIVNAIVLWSFGRQVEAFFLYYHGGMGYVYFLALFLGGALVSGLPAYKKHQNNPSYAAVGVSGAVSSLLFAFIIIQPLSEIYMFFIPIGIPAFIIGILYLIYEYQMDKRAHGKIAHDVHFYGALYGLLFMLVLHTEQYLSFYHQILEYFGAA